jgi:uncharacterized protein YyaL (SSP411 family)
MDEKKEPKVERKPNRLINEKSPYLLQHAYNPVDWFPWGEEAFTKARKENKPIFLSIGYSTCHWCHVMEKEVFDDPVAAMFMNEVFVSIKVDREERPDLDNIYMAASQMLTGSGGWPLNIIMTPDKKPFFAATYIPREGRFSHIGMLELVPKIKEAWRTRNEDVIKSAEQITAALKQAHLGDMPKFPTPHNLLFLLRYWKGTGEGKALEMVEKTLQAMSLGGIYDHVGFGFHRYSTDREWLVPHFEKMLYDQALIAFAYIEANQATGKKEYEETAREIFTYVLRDMTSPEGGFYSAEDADVEGEEGKSYLWSEEEIGKVLPPEDAGLIIKLFNVEKEGNFIDSVTGERPGANILHLKRPVKEIAAELDTPEEGLKERLEGARKKLFDYREKRVHPHKDDKILTDWNGLMIAALSKGAQAFDQPRYAEAAAKAAAFILKKMRTEDGRLLHRYRNGEARVGAFLDDYAFFTWGLIELYEATFMVDYLKAALELNGVLMENFWDEKGGGFYFTSDDSEELPVRNKEFYDGAVPSGNSVAMYNLLRLGRITANAALEEKAAKLGRAFSQSIARAPSAYTQLMCAVTFAVGSAYEVIIAGETKAGDTKEMLSVLVSEFLPNKVVLLRPTEVETPEITDIAAFTKEQLALEGKATAYVCRNYTCSRPTTDKGEMLELLKGK